MIWYFMSFNKFSNNVQDYLPSGSDAAKESFSYDLLTVLLI